MLEAGEYYLEIDDAAIELKKIGKLTIQNRTIKIQLDDIELNANGKTAKRKRH